MQVVDRHGAGGCPRSDRWKGQARHHDMPRHRIQHLPQASNAGFPGVLVYQRVESLVVEPQIRLVEPALLQDVGKQVLPCDHAFFGRRIARKLDDLASVDQRRGHSVERVGRANKRHPGDVDGQVDVVVFEPLVLFGIEQLQQRRRHVAPRSPVPRDFVYLVDEDQWIRDAALSQRVHHPPGERADVRAAVAPDFRFVGHAAEAHPLELFVEARRDRLGDRRLARSRRAHEQQDRRRRGRGCLQGRGCLHPAQHLHDGHVLDDALFDIPHAMMMGVEHAANLEEAEVALCFDHLPRYG